jgi:hypothetical protein
VNREEARRQVLEAIERGEVPKGGPSELAAYDLLDDVPPAYWERWSRGAVERIREQIRDSDAADGGGRDGGQEVTGDG